MYSVTNTFRNAMNDYIIQPVLRGTVAGSQFTQDDILKDSFRCCNQNIAVNDAKLGGVFIGELRMTLLSSIASVRGDWLGKVISCEFGLVTEAGEEYIPCPSRYYTISEANWTDQGLKIVAYDNMVKLEKAYTQEQNSGLAWDWLQYVARKCDIAIGNTETEVYRMTNGNKVLGLDSVDNIETFRDLISYLSMALGGYATIDRNGALVIKQFNGEIVNEIDPTKRFAGCSFSDYQTSYTGISVVNNADGMVEVYNTYPNDGLTMKLGSNPFLQLGTREVKDEIRDNILRALKHFDYVPFKATLLGCCAYDLGDLIRFTGGIAENSVGCIMAYDFGFNSYTISCYGANPSLQSVQTKTDKNISGITKSKITEQLAISSLTNLASIPINNNWNEVGTLTFSVSKAQVILFHGVVKEHITTGGTLAYRYFLNSQELDFIHEVNKFEGVDTTTLFIPITVDANIPNTLRVVVSSSDGARGTVQPLEMRGAVLGVGINLSDWDGNISIKDNFSLALNGGLEINFVDTVNSVGMYDYIPARISDDFVVEINNGVDINFTDALMITLNEKEYRRVTEDGLLRITEDGYYRTTEKNEEE